MNDTMGQTQVVLSFSSTTRAGEALRTFRQLDSAHVLRLVNAAVIVRKPNGDVSIHETGDLSPQAKRALISAGALVGFIVGALWRGIGGGLIGAIVAGQSGAILVTAIDPGFSTLYLEHLAEDIPPGSSLLVASVDFKHESTAAIMQDKFAGANLLRPVLSSPMGQKAAASR